MTEKNNSDITAVIACFNYGRYLPEAIESVLSQDGGAPKVIVVDDESTDGQTIETLAHLPKGIDVIRQQNQGVCTARNAGLERVDTPYALVLDADDRLAPAALRALRAPLDHNPKLGFTYGLIRFFGDWEGVVKFPPYDPYKLLYRHTIGLTALMRHELVKQTGGFDPSFEQLEDWELWVNALAHGWRGQRVNVVTLEYRKHPGAKHREDRRKYRRMFKQLRRKHGDLYRNCSNLSKESDLGVAGRLFYRFFWGTRPVPAVVEQALHRLRWGR